MTSNNRAHQRQALVRTTRRVFKETWFNFTWLLGRFKPSNLKSTYEMELEDVQYEAYEAEARQAWKRIANGDNFVPNKFVAEALRRIQQEEQYLEF